jgi:hypothetical protein
MGDRSPGQQLAPNTSPLRNIPFDKLDWRTFRE